MTEKEKPTAAFILSLIGGIFILLGGGTMSILGYWFSGGYRGRGFGMMGPGFGMMSRLGYGFGVLGVVGLVFGIIVIVSAIMLNSKPEQHSTWGALIVLFSVLSIFGSAMGGFGIGLILGLIGGILAITWKPTQPKT
jgi:hypothetical protein